MINDDAISGLIRMAQRDPEAQVRAATLEALSRLPLSEGGWQSVANATHAALDELDPRSEARHKALRVAARIPLLSVRAHLREKAAEGSDPDSDALEEALAAVGDESQIRRVVAEIRKGRDDLYEGLAAMPIEEVLTESDLPEQEPEPESDAHLWRSVVSARIGNVEGLGAYLRGQMEPPMFWGNPWTPYARIAAARPISGDLAARIQEIWNQVEPNRTGQLVCGALTGMFDAEGTPIPVAPMSPAQPSHAIGVGTGSPDELLTRLADANRQAAELDPGDPRSIELGNTILNFVDGLSAGATWPVASLAKAYLDSPKGVLDEGQWAWIIAKGENERVIRDLGQVLEDLDDLNARYRMLGLLAAVADYQSGRAGSPWRGAGSGVESPSIGPVRELIDDRPEEAAMAPPPAAAPPPPQATPPTRRRRSRGRGRGSDTGERGAPASRGPTRGASDRELGGPAGSRGTPQPTPESRPQERGGPPPTLPPEERRVHADIRHQGGSRRTFVAGAENIIRCWIGLPDVRHAVADEAIQSVEIPEAGLPLEVHLVWKDQADSKFLILPADRTARTGDCDLRLTVPEDERYITAEIVFRYRGAVFEVVHVEAFVLPAGAEEEAHHDIRVQVQMTERGVIELTEREPLDTTFLYGSPPASPQVATGAPPTSGLRIYSEGFAKGYDLPKFRAPIEWLNEELFIAEKSLVRKWAKKDPEAEHDAAEDALPILRKFAEHGTELYNQLTADRDFVDPGERIQLINFSAEQYAPLEFVYDRGYPSSTAVICEGGFEAIEADEAECPTCASVEMTAAERDQASVICPYGFWSIRKIIERRDPGAAQDGSVPGQSGPSDQRRALPAFDKIVFASSHRVPEAERIETWTMLQKAVPNAKPAEDWAAWKEAVEDGPPLLVMLPHHFVQEKKDYLEIGADDPPAERHLLPRGRLTPLYVNPDEHDPGPVVILLGCQTAAETESGYVDLARRFQQLRTSIVLGTLAKILGRHAAPVARELVAELTSVEDPEADFGTIMRRLRRRMLAKGYLMSLCLVALGDAEWRLTPRAQRPND